MSEFIFPPVIGKMLDAKLPDRDEISYYVLEQERKIYLDYDIDEMLTELHRLILRWNMLDAGIEPDKRKPIWLYIMSCGGSLDYMQMLIDVIEASTTPVYTVNIGIAHSAAALIYISGKKRFMTKNAKMVIHEGSASLSGDAQKVQDQAESYKKALAWMKEFILSHTSIPKKDLMKRRTHDWELDADYCLANGACECIVESLDEII